MRPYRVLLLVLVLAALLPSATRADTPAILDVIIPETVSITVGLRVTFIGRPAGQIPVACQTGNFPSQSAVVVDPGGGTASQLTSLAPLHDHRSPTGRGTEYSPGLRIAGSPRTV